MIDLRVDKGMMRIRECEGNTADLIYELTLIAGTLVKMARENNKAAMADLILEWLKQDRRVYQNGRINGVRNIRSQKSKEDCRQQCGLGPDPEPDEGEKQCC